MVGKSRREMDSRASSSLYRLPQYRSRLAIYERTSRTSQTILRSQSPPCRVHEPQLRQQTSPRRNRINDAVAK